MFLAWSGRPDRPDHGRHRVRRRRHSPLAAFFFLPPVFAALSYPRALDGRRRRGRHRGVRRDGGGPRRRVEQPRGRRRPVVDRGGRDVRVAGARARAPARGPRARLARRPADGRAQPPRVRRAPRRRAEPRPSRRRGGRAPLRRPRRLQGHERPPRPRGGRRPAPLGRADDDRRRCGRATASAASAATSSPSSSRARARRRPRRSRTASTPSSRRARRRRSASRPSRSTAPTPRRSTRSRTSTSTPPSTGAPSGARPPGRAS